MCCFSRPVDLVGNTKIFARGLDDGRQALVYSMTMSAPEELSMILPLPVRKDSPENAVRFVNLKEYPGFFEDLERGFPAPITRSKSLGGFGAALGAADPKLAVVDVGDFEASFVPKIADFARLDERFRLPDGTWDKLPAYKDYGFAVFKLKSGRQNVHPMAFEFPRARPKQLFFPTVHIHDGKVHGEAEFDHTLYAQNEGAKSFVKWRESPQPAGAFMQLRKCQGLVTDNHCYRLTIRGKAKNEDVLA